MKFKRNYPQEHAEIEYDLFIEEKKLFVKVVSVRRIESPGVIFEETDFHLPSYVPADDNFKAPVKKIAYHAFSGFVCRSCIIPDSVDCLESEAFDSIRAETINVPKNIKVIPDYCFQCSEIHIITFDNPKGIEQICSGAFSEVGDLYQFVWPEGAKTIPDNCFLNTPVHKITGLDKVEYICERAFEGTHELESLIWPLGVNTIPAYCFSMSGIKRLHNTGHVKSIEPSAFRFADNLEDICFPNVSAIGSYAFAGCCPDIQFVLGDGTEECLILHSNSFSEEIKVDVSAYLQVNVIKDDDTHINLISGFETEVKYVPYHLE